MRIVTLMVIFGLWLGALIAKPWGFHALIKDPNQGSIYLQWFDEPKQDGAVKIQEKGATLFTSDNPTEINYGSPGWRLYRLDLSLSPRSIWTMNVHGEEISVKTPPKSLPLKIAVGGDMLGQKGRFQRINEVVQEENPDLVIMGGDLAYALNGTREAKAFKVALEQWEAFFAAASNGIRDPDGALLPWFVVVGNHDYNHTQAGSLFLTFFSNKDQKAKRVIDFQGLSIFGLDTGHVEPIEGEQTEWLASELGKRKSVLWKIAAYHIGAYPAYYSSKGTTPTKVRSNWCPLFEEGGVIAAFEHHSHGYKRTFPLVGGAVSPKGVTYFGDGCWGVRPRKYTFDAEHFAKAARVNHIYILDVMPEQLHVKAISDEGYVFDGAQFSKNALKKS